MPIFYKEKGNGNLFSSDFPKTVPVPTANPDFFKSGFDFF